MLPFRGNPPPRQLSVGHLAEISPSLAALAETSYALTTPCQELIFAIPGHCLAGPYLLCLWMVPP